MMGGKITTFDSSTSVIVGQKLSESNWLERSSRPEPKKMAG